jgi:ABC-type dipeptide/oligopeptide/nickel transport system ATPase subunit
MIGESGRTVSGPESDAGTPLALTVARDTSAASAASGTASGNFFPFSEWKVGSGETWWVRGASGSGKTTLLGLVLGLRAVRGWQARWFDSRGAQLGWAERARFVAGVSQQPRFWQSQVREVLRAPWGFGARRAHLAPGTSPLVPSESAEAALLQALGLPAAGEFLARAPDQLSGGERSRLGLARALLLDPEALVLDEPTAGLDSESADRVLNQLLEWKNKRPGRGLLLASHDERWVSAFSPRVLGLASAGGGSEQGRAE